MKSNSVDESFPYWKFQLKALLVKRRSMLMPTVNITPGISTENAVAAKKAFGISGFISFRFLWCWLLCRYWCWCWFKQYYSTDYDTGVYNYSGVKSGRIVWNILLRQLLTLSQLIILFTNVSFITDFPISCDRLHLHHLDQKVIANVVKHKQKSLINNNLQTIYKQTNNIMITKNNYLALTERRSWVVGAVRSASTAPRRTLQVWPASSWWWSASSCWWWSACWQHCCCWLSACCWCWRKCWLDVVSTPPSFDQHSVDGEGNFYCNFKIQTLQIGQNYKFYQLWLSVWWNMIFDLIKYDFWFDQMWFLIWPNMIFYLTKYDFWFDQIWFLIWPNMIFNLEITESGRGLVFTDTTARL